MWFMPEVLAVWDGPKLPGRQWVRAKRFLIMCHDQPGYRGKKGSYWQYSRNAIIRLGKYGSIFYILTP